MHLFDTHCHLMDERFREDLPAVLERMNQTGVCRAVVIGEAAEAGEVPGILSLCEAREGFYAACGVHPHNASEWNAAAEPRMRTWLEHPKMRAVGEIGLDYHYDLSPRPAQIEAFEAQLDIAFEKNLPVVLHIREAHGDATDILRARHVAGRLPLCVMHCYSGSWESAKAYLAMGLYISFSGSVTFKNAPKLREVAQKMPEDRLLVETDSPYLAPEPMRGKRNEPSFVLHTLTRVAEIRGVLPEVLAEVTTQNGKRFFRIA